MERNITGSTISISYENYSTFPRDLSRFRKKNGTIGTQDPCSCRGFCYESSNYQLIRYYATLSVHQINYFSTNLFILTFDLRSVDIFSRTTATQNRMYLVLFGPDHAVTGTSKGFSKQSISM